MLNFATNILSYGIQTKLMGQRNPLLASFKLTFRCNLTCSGCPYHLRSGENLAHMDKQTALSALKHLHEIGCRFIIFEGGEPLLWRDNDFSFLDLVTVANSMFVRTGVTTNGTLPLNIPTDLLWVSIDGTPQQHDKLRSLSYNRIMNNIENSGHTKIMIHYTVNSDNYQEIQAATQALSRHRNIKGITFQFFYPYDQGEADLLLTQQQRSQAIETILELKQHGPLPVLNSRKGLKVMLNNQWQCHEWMLANADPDGRISSGCYVRGRGEIHCENCGFTPVAEASLAYDLHPGPIMAGFNIFS